jgi:NCS1 family nucleobase:cation symporter-1
MNSAVYEGPIATALGGVDIAWIVGLLVAGALYLALSRTATAPSGAPVDAELPLDAAAAESARA